MGVYFNQKLRKAPNKEDKDMTKETRLMLLLDERDEAMAKIDAIYDDNYASEGSTAESTLELNMWYEEEKGKIENKYIQSIVELFEGEKA